MTSVFTAESKVFVSLAIVFLLFLLHQNISKSEEGDYVYLRINFFYPGRFAVLGHCASCVCSIGCETAK